MTTSRRRHGSGTIFWRADGLWVGRAKGKQVTSRKFCETLRKFSDLHPYRPEFSIPAPPRVEAMREARERGRHTAREWFALGISVGWRCYYCGIQCSSHNRPHARITKEHRIPVSRGGSDAIENIVVACKRCNSDKGTMTDEEYQAIRRPRREAMI